MVQTRLHKHSLSKKEQAVSSVASRASVRDPIDEFQDVYGSRAGSAAFRQQLGSDFSRSGQIQPPIQAKPSFRGLSQEIAAESQTVQLQEKENKTSLPDDLKAGVEALSGFSMDDVRVHYNSSKPAQLQALAYTQGTEIHVGPGQERHLAHEAWHVVQQMQGRVKPTMQMKGKPINVDKGLEREADEISHTIAHLKPRDSLEGNYSAHKYHKKKYKAQKNNNLFSSNSSVQLMQDQLADIDELLQISAISEATILRDQINAREIVSSISPELTSSTFTSVISYLGIPITVANNLLSGASYNLLSLITSALSIGLTCEYLKKGWRYKIANCITETEWYSLICATVIYFILNGWLTYEGSQLENETELTRGHGSVITNITIGVLALLTQKYIENILSKGSNNMLEILVGQGINNMV